MNQEMFMALVMTAIAYLIGSVSPSILLAKAKGIDIKNEGSGNAGTTNTLRVLGPGAAVFTLIVDIGKGFLAVWLGGYLMSYTNDFIIHQTMYLCAVGVACGHVWPLYFKFKGGKGVATAFGAMLAINPMIALIALGIAALGVAISRRMSVGSILGAVALPLLCLYFEFNFALGATFMAVLVLYTHRQNMMRLRMKTEPKMSFGKKGK